MSRIIRLLAIAQTAQAFIHNLLEIRLAHVDDIDDAFSMSKTVGRRFFVSSYITFWCTHCPELAPIVLDTPRDKVELNAQIVGQAKLPQLVCDVLGRVRRSAIATYQNLIACTITFV